MDKRRYYVSVQAGTVMLNQGDAAYEWEIDATPEEVDKLMDLFGAKWDSDHIAFWRNHVPGLPYHFDSANDQYDQYLREIYNMIYELGTPETRQTMEANPSLLHSYRPENE
ncbi:hypothetical protein [Brevibacillus massiliensis]|uniref:hypothetical protein n=1 Tax=Brevibacillus massiliensis TaxID=1118054 RepID=UPI000313011D|nr:hypothetical protein [Brevibacillus massiliensis]